MRIRTLASLACLWLLGGRVEAQPKGFNEDEAKVPTYTLPDPLTMSDGTRVVDAETWRTKRRPEILALFESQMYGKAPGRPKDMNFTVRSVDENALGGRAIRKEVVIRFLGKPGGPGIDLLIYLPKGAKGPVPAFVGLNFQGNHAIQDDPGITISDSWMRDDPRGGVVNHRSTEKSRGAEMSRWPVKRIIERGYGVVTANYNDIDPDYDDGFKNGVHELDDRPRGPDSWGSVAAWAWGLSRALDYIETDRAFDPKRVAVHGHSRLGKASVWAGAKDERFALVISNDSGEGGVALSHRDFGETVARINASFPHWFCENYKKYSGHEAEMPFDQHMLVSLIAPRPVLICSAEEDRWADPRGEFLAGKGADPGLSAVRDGWAREPGYARQ